MKNIPYWLDIPYTPRPALTTDATVQVVVIGGGITGISAAYHCTKAGFKTILIEKDVLGFGSAGRNGGMIVEGMEIDFSAAAEKFGKEKAQEIWNTSIQARRLIQSLISGHSIDCDFEQVGSIYISTSESESQKLQKEADIRAEAGLIFEMLGKNQLPKSSPFDTALFNSADALIHPVKFIRGLALAAEKQGLTIYEHTAATSFDAHTVVTSQGTIHADSVIVALESSSQPLPQDAKLNRSQAIVTEPLSVEALQKMDWQKSGMVWPTDDDYISCRKIGNRLFSCKTIALEPTEKDYTENQQWQINKIRSFFPTLTPEDLKISHYWTGLMVSTPDYQSRIRATNGYYEIYGHAGLGLTNGVMTGKVVANHLATGEKSSIYQQ